jgi:hypothetical protein
MAILYVSEYTDIPTSVNAWFRNMAPEPSIVDQTIPITGSSNVSNAFSGSTNVVRLHTDAICSVSFGTSPTATATNKRLAQNQTEYFSVKPGSKVAVITNV